MEPEMQGLFLKLLGIPDLPARTVPFDPGHSPNAVCGHLAQSSHLMYYLKLSMACWLIAGDRATRAKIAAAKQHGVPVVAGGGLFEIAAAEGYLDEYFELCAKMGFDRIEAGEGFAAVNLNPKEIVKGANAFGLFVQYEVGRKLEGKFSNSGITLLLDRGKAWLDAGAKQLVIEARESASNVGLFDDHGQPNLKMADKVVKAVGGDFDLVQFEVPTKESQFRLLDHFGPSVMLSNVPLNELLRVEIYRRRLHSQSYRPPVSAGIP
jgi:phosphosulfolactate synthase